MIGNLKGKARVAMHAIIAVYVSHEIFQVFFRCYMNSFIRTFKPSPGMLVFFIQVARVASSDSPHVFADTLVDHLLKNKVYVIGQDMVGKHMHERLRLSGSSDAGAFIRCVIELIFIYAPDRLLCVKELEGFNETCQIIRIFKHIAFIRTAIKYVIQFTCLWSYARHILYRIALATQAKT